VSQRGDDPLQLLGRLPRPSELRLFTPGELVVHAADLRDEALVAIKPLEDLHGQATHAADLGHADLVDVELYTEDFFGSTPPPGVQHETTQFTRSLGDGEVAATIAGQAPDFPSLAGAPPQFTSDDFLFDPQDLPEHPDLNDPGPRERGPKTATVPTLLPEVVRLSTGAEKVDGETAGERERRLAQEARDRGKVV
jgi:hypothetical protein